jgi:hypothetical protein
MAPMAKQLSAPSSPLGRFVDSLIQTFEDCRHGLSDDTVREGDEAIERFFLELYERETERLETTIKTQEPHLSEDAQRAYQREVDALIRGVVVPAYVRLAKRVTPKERNEFYLTPEHLHALERIGFGLVGILIGAFVIWAPFIPLWDKELIIPFMILGLFFPNIRKYFALRKYEKELNHLVARADRELSRIDIAYLESGEVIDELADLEKRAKESELESKLANLAHREKEH